MMDETDGRGPAGAAPEGEAVPGKRVQARWTKKRKDLFLSHLSATCHVAEAAAAAGVPRSSVYWLRRLDAEFAAGWGEAVKLGYQELELRLIRHALTGGGQKEIDGRGLDGEGQLHVELALQLLSTHRNGLLGKIRAGRPVPRVATREETTAAILQKLEVVERRYRAKGLLPPLLPAPAEMPLAPETSTGADA